jgi:hypothetical protein
MEKCAVGIPDEHDVVLHPFAGTDHRKLPPQRAVGDQLVPLQLFSEHRLEKCRSLNLREMADTKLVEGVRVHFEDPGRAPLFVLIGMDDDDSLRDFLEPEGEGIERARRSHPDKAVWPQVGLWLEMICVGFADAAVDAVGRNDQIITARQHCWIVDLLLEQQFYTKLPRPVLQEHQQRPARAAAEAVAADAVRIALEMDFDVVPVGEAGADRLVTWRIRRLERVKRLVRENHAETECVICLVALDDRDVQRRPVTFHQEREIEACRPAACHRDAHERPPLSLEYILGLK